MVDMPVLFDTNILIDYLSSRPQARIELDGHSDRAISIVTWMEVMVGSTTADEDKIQVFLKNFYTLPLTSEIAERAVRVRRDRKIKLPDAIIQASAELAGRVLVTRNTRDFPDEMPGIRIPYTL
jgi:predicted nucleic acid-binding protein